MRLLLIANPVSGRNARTKIDRAVALLTQAGFPPDLHLTVGPGDARDAAATAAASNYDRILVAGGDGTLNEVINGIAPATTPIACLPLGTVNVFALEANIPFDLAEACELAVGGTVRRISLGRINGQGFLLMASAGWDADAVARLRPRVKRWFGRLAYGLSAAEALLAGGPAPLSVTLADGRRREGYGLVVSNCRFYGGRYVVTPQASMFSDSLEVCLLRRRGRLAMLGFAASLALGRALGPPGVEFHRVERLEVDGEGIPVQVDGDAWGRLPVRIEAWPQAASLVLPSQGGQDER